MTRVDVREVFQSYSRRLLHEFREGQRTSTVAYDRGRSREENVRNFLSEKLPGRYAVGEGLVVDQHGGQSRQCDVVIYDSEQSPRLSTETALSIWPFESVYGVVEVKSVLNETALKEAVENIAAFKSLSREDNVWLGGGGFYTRSDKQNPALGMLVAHECDAGLSADKIHALVESVPRESQLDAYCIISGRIAFRATDTGQGVLIDVYSAKARLLESDYGDGALAAFLLILATTMNGIRLGTGKFLPYLKFLSEP